MPLNEIIILAGGLGTRLRSVVSDVPKCMAPVNGKPFLSYVIDYFKQQGIESHKAATAGATNFTACCACFFCCIIYIFY